MSGRRKKDHGFREIKWILRRRLAAGVRPGEAADLYAGDGSLAAGVLGGFERVFAVERSPKKFSALLSRLEAESVSNVIPLRMNNLRFAREIAPRLGGICYLDFDAYGNPAPTIEAFFRDWRPRERVAVAVTDGSRLAMARGGKVKAEALWPGRPGGRRGGQWAKPGPVLAANHELAVKAYWRDLAERKGFAIKGFIDAWKRGRMVYYYGLWIEPN